MFNAFRDLIEEEREIWFENHGDNRPAINPDFAPDEDCNIAYEVKCIPGSQRSCLDLEGYHNGEDNVCSPIKCQEGYHTEYDLETGLCLPNEVECPDTMVFVESGDDEYPYGDRCTPLYTICDEAEHREEDYCIEYCEENPDRLACKTEAN